VPYLCRTVRGSIPLYGVFTTGKQNTKKKKQQRVGGRQVVEEEEAAVMAAADGGAKPLQSAMKMAKVAIQLDGENKHKVELTRCFTAATTRRLSATGSPERCQQREGAGPVSGLASYAVTDS